MQILFYALTAAEVSRELSAPLIVGTQVAPLYLWEGFPGLSQEWDREVIGTRSFVSLNVARCLPEHGAPHGVANTALSSFLMFSNLISMKW